MTTTLNPDVYKAAELLREVEGGRTNSQVMFLLAWIDAHVVEHESTPGVRRVGSEKLIQDLERALDNPAASVR